MKRLSLLAALIALLLSIPALAEMETPVYETYQKSFISSADNTVIKSSSGVLAGIKVSGGTFGSIIVYDGMTCSGTIVDNVASTEIYAGLVMPYGVAMSNGICVYTSAATKLVVIYK